jgi:hypothetical protein
MLNILLAGLKGVATKALTVVASKAMLEWLLFWVAEMVVQSTKTTKDDAWFKEFKKQYEQSEREETK